MAKSYLSLDRLLNTPHLERVVSRLQPEVLHRVIQHYGLEECGEFIALASSRQIGRLLDADVWRTRAGGDPVFDVERFGLWLSVLMQSGPGIAAGKLTGIDTDLVVAGLTGHIVVSDCAAVSSYTTLDGEHVAGRESDASRTAEIGGYFLEAKDAAVWDVIVDLLVFLDDQRPAYFQQLMQGCVRLSSGASEADGFYSLLTENDQHLFDVGDARERRRDTLGYITTARAQAFLQGAKQLQLDAPAPPESPLWRAYVRELRSDCESGELHSPRLPAAPPEAAHVATEDPDAAVAAVVDLLVDAGVLIRPEPQYLLAVPDSDAGAAPLALVQAHVVAHASAAEELAYLANVLLAGCRIQGREFSPPEASAAAAATCNLGLEHRPGHWSTVDLVTAFQIGWQLLQQDVCLHTARQLGRILGTVNIRDRDLDLQLRGLRATITQAVTRNTPSRVRDNLEVLLLLDAPSWAGLLALLDECPVINAAVRGSGGHTIKPQDFDFISSRGDIAATRRFIDRLPAMLQP